MSELPRFADSGYELRPDSLFVSRVPLLPASYATTALTTEGRIASLRRLVSERPYILTALAVASRSLHDAVARWLSGSTELSESAAEKLNAYVVRMSTRATPFGLCAGVGMVFAGGQHDLVLDEASEVRTETYPDAAWLERIRHKAEQELVSSLDLVVFSNPQMLIRAGRVFIPSGESPAAHKRSTNGRAHLDLVYQSASVSYSRAVAATIEHCGGGATIGSLIDFLRHHEDLGVTNPSEFARRLCRAGILLTSLRTAPVSNAAASLLRTLSRTASDLAPHLASVLAGCRQVDSVSVRDRVPSHYDALLGAMADLDSRRSAAVNTVMVHTHTGLFGRNVLEEVERMASVWIGLARRVSLSSFRKSFVERYESEERLVPLLEIFSSDFGMQASTDLTPDYDDRTEAARHIILARAVARAHQRATNEIVLSDDEVAALCGAQEKGDVSCLPESIEVGFTVAACDSAAIRRGDFLVAPAAIPITHHAGASVGRFAKALGSVCVDQLSRTVNREASGAIQAELIYASADKRMDNLVSTPDCSRYAILVDCTDGVRAERIDLSDLDVGIHDGRVLLWSRRHQREVIVHKLHMLSTQATTPLIRFLANVSLDGLRMPRIIDWGQLQVAPHRPRLRWGRVVLSRAAWSIPTAAVSGKECKEWFRSYCTEWNVPAIAHLVEGDNKLLLAPRSDEGIRLIARAAGRAQADHLVIEEPLPGPGQHWLARGTERYASEFVISYFNHKTTASRDVPARRRSPVTRTQRLRGPGSEWTYTKFYCGAYVADIILRDHVRAFVAQATLDNRVDRWFFIRYADPDWHIRLRMRCVAGDADSLRRDLAQHCERMLRLGAVDRVVYDVYEREVERYGGLEAIEIAETMFCENSKAAVADIRANVGRPSILYEAALREGAVLLGALADTTGIERWVSTNEPTVRKLSPDGWKQVKKLRQHCARVLEGADRREGYERCAVLYRTLEDARILSVPLDQIISSLLHMHFNRYGLTSDQEPGARRVMWHAFNGLLRT